MSPFILVIFGATGDLTNRKLMPAIYHLSRSGRIPPNAVIVGVGRRPMDDAAFRALMRESARQATGGAFSPEAWETLAANTFYRQGFFEDAALYDELTRLLSSFDAKMNACIARFFYLATPPANYEVILRHLHESKLSEGCGQGTPQYTRVLIEKPFGSDLTTAQHLDELLGKTFQERQIYRIDHYLGKETVQNILALRFANGIFEPTWNHTFIDHVQITLAEDEGVGSRGTFYDSVGALRDVVQNHMLEMLALVAMEQPRGFDADSIRDEKVAVLGALSNGAGEACIRGQYQGYTAEPGISARSQTETFVAVRLEVATDRWRGVPFYLRTGKYLKAKATEISLHFKKPVCAGDVCFFDPNKVLRNILAIRIQPDEGITLRLMVKQPGFGMQLADTKMEFGYNDAFPGDVKPDAYERLLLDVIAGDQTLFARTDGIAASWQYVTGILTSWSEHKPPLHTYQAGSWGPAAADDFIAADSRHWFLHNG